MGNNSWITDVLIDMIRFAEDNDMPYTAEELRKAFDVTARELALQLPVRPTPLPRAVPGAKVVRFPVRMENRAKGT